MNASDHQYDAKVKVPSEYVKHHAKEEEIEMLMEVADTDANLERSPSSGFCGSVSLWMGARNDPPLGLSGIVNLLVPCLNLSPSRLDELAF